MNQRLIEHGIMQEESDYRIHVGFEAGAIYVFPTENGKKAVRSGEYSTTSAGQPGVYFTTSKAVLVPWHKIKGCKEIPIPPALLRAAKCRRSDSTSIKGRKALCIVQMMQQIDLVPISFAVTEVRNETMQIAGVDLTTRPVTIQVKCDFKCGAKERGGTGNLYLETHECNPLGRI